VLSLLLAALILAAGSPLLAAGVALAMLAFTALDIRELTHQLHESRAGLAALAATVALLHLLAAAAALRAARDTRRQSGPDRRLAARGAIRSGQAQRSRHI
jgi:uncharacterized membrane protein YidH (DUF202 family)